MPREYVRKTQRAKWTEEQLNKALDSIRGGRKIREVARAFEIHEATLRTRMKMGNKEGPKLGRKPIFSYEQEKELENHILAMAKLFYGISCLQLRRIAFEFAEANQITNNFDKSSRLAGKDWLTLFLKRNSGIRLRKPEATSLNRILAFNQDEVNTYFQNLDKLFEKYQFKEDKIFNVDETGINTVQKPERILAPKGVKQIGGATSWERGKNVTVICCFSAAGSYVPPMFIFPRKRMTPLLSKGGPVGAIYGCSVNGWSNETLFFEWIQHFQKNVKSSIEEPVLLILDNHSSHISIDIFNFCKQNGIVMVTIPPHTSHRLQPLDVTFFSSLKAAFNRECDLFMKSRVYEKISPYELAELFNKAYMKVATMDKGQSGFKSCGIWPFNPDKFNNIDNEPCASFRDIVLEDNETVTEEPQNEVEKNPNRPKPSCPDRSADQFPGSSKETQVPIVWNIDPPFQKSVESSAINPKPVKVAEISPLPKKTKIGNPQEQQTKGRPKGKSVILTATPEKIKLELKIAIKKEKDELKKVKEEKKKAKAANPEKNKTRPKTKLGSVGKKKIAHKRKLKLDSESSSDDDVCLKDICDDNEVDDIDLTEDVCLVCGECGKDQEVWFRCVICGHWSHDECSGWDTAENYQCDICISRTK